MDEYCNTILDCIHRVSQEEISMLWEVIVSVILSKKKCICTCVLFRAVSEVQLCHCTGVWIWRPILPFTPAVLRHCMKRVNRCEVSDGHCDCWLWHCRSAVQNAAHLHNYRICWYAVRLRLLRCKKTLFESTAANIHEFSRHSNSGITNFNFFFLVNTACYKAAVEQWTRLRITRSAPKEMIPHSSRGSLLQHATRIQFSTSIFVSLLHRETKVYYPVWIR